MHIVTHTPIRKNQKTYGVGETFPYSDKDKSLLDKGYLTEVKDSPTKKTVETPKAKDTVEEKLTTAQKKAKAKKDATAKKRAEAKKNNSKK